MKMKKPVRHAGNYSKIHDAWQHMDYPIKKINGVWICGKETKLQEIVLQDSIVSMFDSRFFHRLDLRTEIEQDGQIWDGTYMFQRRTLVPDEFYLRIIVHTDGTEYDFPEY